MINNVVNDKKVLTNANPIEDKGFGADTTFIDTSYTDYSKEGKTTETSLGEDEPTIEIKKEAEVVISSNYMSHKTRIMIKSITDSLRRWEELGSEDALVEISRIKDSLEELAQYSYIEPQNRMLIGLISLIFENNNWSDMKTSSINYLRRELLRFDSGYISKEDVSKFAEQLYRGKVRVLDTSQVSNE